MTEDIKYLIFKGIEKKEQILFKSFLNLSKNELDYQIVVLKDNQESEQPPSVVIAGDDYDFSEDEKGLSALPIIIIGSDVADERPGYLSRPVQWSDFRAALSVFDNAVLQLKPELELVQGDAEKQEPETASDVVEQTEAAKPLKLELVLDDEDDVVESEPDRVLPAEVMFAINDEPSELTEEAAADDADFPPIDFEYELDNMSIDYNSHTNSDYMKVVDDVQQFNVDAQAKPEAAQGAMLLVTDDESNSTNSVLVIETNSLDAWDFSLDEATPEATDEATSAKEAVAEMESANFEELVANTEKSKQKSGLDLAPDEKYWLADNEIIADDITVLYVKSQRGMVYSSAEPGKWVDELHGKKLTKLPLNSDWRPKKELTAYPLSHLLWANSLMNNSSKLNDGLSDDSEYLLETWPHFDLLQLDNVLLKLCSMMFVNPESLNSLVEKSGYSRMTVRGLMNACHQEGILKKASEIQVENLAPAENDGVFGKIKDVFR